MGMSAELGDPYGQFLQDYFGGDTSAAITVHRDDGYFSEMTADRFFRTPAQFTLRERLAMDLCRGRVLDVGAGTGCHTLALQDRGINVVAIDISPDAVALMRRRGVWDARLVDVFALREERFDTLLMMMHGIGMVGDLAGLDRYLEHVHTLLAPNGQVIFDSLDVRMTDRAVHQAYLAANRQAGCYFGEIRMRFSYKGRMGSLIRWLHVDPETLAEHAARAGWRCRVVEQDEVGDYLAQLTAMA